MVRASVRGIGVAVITSRCGSCALLAQGGALHHAEAVLLVDHGQPQPLELDAVLDERMRADDDGGLRRWRARSRAAARSFGRLAARQQDRLQPKRRQQRAQAAIVLLGQDLGRGHQGALVAVRGGGQQRGRGNHGLARADIALQQAAHGPARARRSARISRIALRCAPVKAKGSDALESMTASAARVPALRQRRRLARISSGAGIGEDQRGGNGQRNRLGAVAASWRGA